MLLLVIAIRFPQRPSTTPKVPARVGARQRIVDDVAIWVVALAVRRRLNKRVHA